ncbi:MAG: hypothetical protein QNJ71_10880 [Acidimicrobiia bacterium]|nr:hypothetical protein [Acidimicrobiia bacterium]
MNDTDRVYALFMQANPVPDANLLPMTRDEAALPLMEGSTIMDAQETIQVQPTEEQTRGWRPVAVAAAAFVAVLVIVGGSLMLLLGGEGEPVAAGDASPVVTCDGETCTYAGPTTITPGVLRIEFVNNGDRTITAALWRMSGAPLENELAEEPAGTDVDLTPDDPPPLGSLEFSTDVEPGSTVSESAEVAAGYTYLVDCLTTASTGDDAYHDHLWRPAAIEVVEP